MKISIALATYNGAIYLQEQLDSYIAQERLPDEVVVCDDVSTDDTVEILEAFKRSVPFQVRIIKNQCNLGFTKNFEKAILNCIGDLIILSDQDDIWFPEKIRIIEDTFRKNPDKYLLIHDGDLVDDDFVSHGATKLGQVKAGYGSEDFAATGALTAIRKELFQYVLPIPDGIVGHDGWLHNIARLLDKRMVICQSLQSIRRHSANTSGWVASSLNPINRVTVAKSQFSTQPASSYDDRLLYNTSLSERLHAIESIAHSGISTSLISAGLDHLREERKAIVSREELIQLNFIRRKVKAIQILTCGDYAHFNGLKSFMRDIFR